MRTTRFFLVCLFSLSLPAIAAEPGDEAIRDAVRSLMPSATDITISATPLAGVREIGIGTQVLYASADGKFLLGGPLLDAASGANLTEERVAGARARLLAERPEATTIAWPATKQRHTVTVVTDIDCPYCRKLHKEIPALNAAGISVQYIMLPRAGRNSPSYDKTVGAACAGDAPEAITQAMLGAAFDRATCDNPVDKHMRLAQELGVTSTPVLVLPDGEMVAGYRSADAIVKLLDE